MKRNKKRIWGFIILVVVGSLIYVEFFSNNVRKDNVINASIDKRKDDLVPITGDTIVDSLYNLSTKDKRILNIIKEKDNYPKELLEMLSKNIDMIDFVLEYNARKGKVFSENVGKVEKGKYPLMLQYDKRWGYGIYGDKVMAINGCGPTAVAMAIAGLTGRNDVTPYDVAKFAYDNGYYGSSGTSWSLMTTGVNHFGLSGRELPLSESVMINELNNGHPIICSMRPGDFTSKGHFVLITGIKNGMFVINDSNSKERSSMLWSYERISKQIKNLWAFSVKQK